MPQVFQVLCCYKCEMFQVHQVKKSNQWQCRVCNEKQSLKKAFKIGSSHDCRHLVQELNMRKSGFTEEVNEDCEDGNAEQNEDFHIFKKTKEEEDNLNQFIDSCENEPWSEDEENNDNRYLSDSFYRASKSSSAPAVDQNKYISENTINEENAESNECVSSVATSKLLKTVTQYEPVLDSSVSNPETNKKRSIETDSIKSVKKSALMPYKKNKGFQIILKAASKLS